jgi:hypothetical protein
LTGNNKIEGTWSNGSKFKMKVRAKGEQDMTICMGEMIDVHGKESINIHEG